jgi:hypothetical protein
MKHLKFTCLCLVASCTLKQQSNLSSKGDEPFVTLDLKIGEPQVIDAHGSQYQIELLELREERDSVRQAIRHSSVTIRINEEETALVCGDYHLPRRLLDVRVDCEVSKGWLLNSKNGNVWALSGDARMRIFEIDQIFEDGEFIFPLNARLFTSQTQAGNRPVFVNGEYQKDQIYYHDGFDIGANEGQTEVFAATAGLVIHKSRNNVVIRDGRGWVHRYWHMDSTDSSFSLGARIPAGFQLGLVGKQSGSGGWSHLHYSLGKPQPSGRFGSSATLAFLWEAYHRQYQPSFFSIARDHQVGVAGETLKFVNNGLADRDPGLSFSWTKVEPDHSVDSNRVVYQEVETTGREAEFKFEHPGGYQVIQKSYFDGQLVDMDFTDVQIRGLSDSQTPPPTIHASYHPSLGLLPDTEITFKARTFTAEQGTMYWDMGDSNTYEVDYIQHTEGDRAAYYTLTHRYASPGLYLARVSYWDRDLSIWAINHLKIFVGDDDV